MQEIQVSLPVGAIIQERYIVESLFGKGDFGSVYLVRDQHNKQKLFILAEMINPHEQEKYRFALEYVSLTPLNHRALPDVQYTFNDDELGRAYLLMSYIEGPNLEISRLQQPEKRFPLPQVMAIMAPVINAVTYLHRRSPPIIHRNIKPATIIVPPMVDGPVLVMLDIVKEHGSTTTTLHYVAPGYGATEQYSEQSSTRTDIYGLGATYYTLLTGLVPPDALSRKVQLESKGSDPLEPLNKVIPNISLHITESIHRAMSLSSNDRFSTVEQFTRALNIDPTWKLSSIEKQEFDLALNVPSKQQFSSEPIIVSSPSSYSPVAPEQKEDPESAFETVTRPAEVKSESIPTTREGEVRPAPAPVAEPEEMVPEVKPTEEGMVPEPGEIRPALEAVVEEAEARSEPMSVAEEEEERPTHTLTAKKEDEPTSEPVTKPEETVPEPDEIGSVVHPIAEEGEVSSAPEPLVKVEKIRPKPAPNRRKKRSAPKPGETRPASIPVVE
ncbi:MAG: hypothetical protein NVSMB27_35380 [Ktedonobacteraceae bacterium]